MSVSVSLDAFVHLGEISSLTGSVVGLKGFSDGVGELLHFQKMCILAQRYLIVYLVHNVYGVPPEFSLRILKGLLEYGLKVLKLLQQTIMIKHLIISAANEIYGLITY